MGKDRHKIIPASYLFLTRGSEEVLLLGRQNTGYKDGFYSVVAGHVDEGESFTEAMIREAKEEAGIEIRPDNLKLVHIIHRVSDDGSERVDAFFVADQWQGEVTLVESEKCFALDWFKISELPENIIPFVRRALESWQEGVFYSEEGWDTK